MNKIIRFVPLIVSAFLLAGCTEEENLSNIVHHAEYEHPGPYTTKKQYDALLSKVEKQQEVLFSIQYETKNKYIFGRLNAESTSAHFLYAANGKGNFCYTIYTGSNMLADLYKSLSLPSSYHKVPTDLRYTRTASSSRHKIPNEYNKNSIDILKKAVLTQKADHTIVFNYKKTAKQEALLSNIHCLKSDAKIPKSLVVYGTFEQQVDMIAVYFLNPSLLDELSASLGGETPGLNDSDTNSKKLTEVLGN